MINQKETYLNNQEKTETYLDEGAEIQANFDADEGIGAAFVGTIMIYNFTGEWMTDEMKIEGEEVYDENGVCYAYSGATWCTSVIPYSGDSQIYYQVIFSDGNKTSSRTDVLILLALTVVLLRQKAVTCLSR